MTTLRLEGMRSVHCVRAAFTALAAVPGIERADVTMGRAVVEHDGTATVDALREALSIVGYTVASASETRRTLPMLGDEGP